MKQKNGADTHQTCALRTVRQFAHEMTAFQSNHCYLASSYNNNSLQRQLDLNLRQFRPVSVEAQNSSMLSY